MTTYEFAEQIYLARSTGGGRPDPHDCIKEAREFDAAVHADHIARVTKQTRKAASVVYPTPTRDDSFLGAEHSGEVKT